MATTDETGKAPGALAWAAFQALPLGTVLPTGWLREQLRLQGDGLTGRLEELWPDVGPVSAWLGGQGEDWERGPYYCDGLVPLAYLLQDEALIAKARRWMDAVLSSQRDDGQFGPHTNDDWWPRMVMLKALAQYQEATGDARVIPFMMRYCHYQLDTLPDRPLSDWSWVRGADNALTVYWLYERTGAPSLLALADLILAQTFDWGAYLGDLPALARARVTAFAHQTHVVNVAMGLKTPALRYRRDGDPAHLRAVETAWASLMQYHGQVEGIFSGDEWLAGTDPAQGVELCAVVELMFTLEQLVGIYGAGCFADRLETLTYNALPATITADMRARQYDQQPNQVLCTVAPRQWTQNDETANTFGLEPHFGCCTANMHQGWPKLVQSLWMGAADGGFVAVAYAPCVVQTRVRGDTVVTIEETTEYPFKDTVRFTIHADRPATFPLFLRIPAWCATPTLHVNGRESAVDISEQGFVTVQRAWTEGDTIDLALPMRVRVIERPRGAIGVALGPLVFGLAIDEEWTRIAGSRGFGDWEVRPRTLWNYALAMDLDHPDATCRVEWRGVGSPPFGHTQAPVRIHAMGHRVPGWELVRNSAGPLPASPLTPSTAAEPVTLLPYGCARLRIAEFPHVLPRPDPPASPLGSRGEPASHVIQTVANNRHPKMS